MTTEEARVVVRPLPVREIGFALIGLGAVGIIAVIVAFFVVGGIVARLDAMTAATEGPLRSTARTISDASDAFEGFGSSLAQARRSSEHAAELVVDTGATLNGLADTMSIQIFGTQPLLPAAEGFRDAAQQLDGLGADLQTLSDTLGANVDDVETTGENLQLVRDEMDELLAAFEGDEGSDGGVGLATLGIYVLLGWLALMALGSAVIGVLLVRR